MKNILVRILAFVLVLTMVFAFAACTKEEPKDTEGPIYSNNGYKFIKDKDGNITGEDFTISSKADKIPELALFKGKYYFIVSISKN